MPVFDQLQRMSFAGVEFPWSEIKISGAIRDVVHEYPHTPGGAPEKLGRKLYVFHVTAQFDAKNLRYRDLYPGTLDDVIGAFEAEATAPLVIPTIGTVPAYATTWTRTASAKLRSGEKVEIEFREDQSALFLASALINVKAETLQDKIDTLDNFKSLDGFPSSSLFDGILDAANAVLAIRDTVDAYGSVFESKLLGLAALIREFDRADDLRNDPTAFRIVDAMHDLWDATNELLADIQSKGGPLRHYTVPVLMSMGQVAFALYRDSARGGDLLSLNAVLDPFAIEAGTDIRYYADAA